MNLKNIGLLLLFIGFVSFWFGPDWLTLVGCIGGPILLITDSFKKKKNDRQT